MTVVSFKRIIIPLYTIILSSLHTYSHCMHPIVKRDADRLLLKYSNKCIAHGETSSGSVAGAALRLY